MKKPDKTTGLLSFCVSFVLFGACAVGGEEGIQGQEKAPTFTKEQLEQLEEAACDIRGLKFLGPVDYEVIDKESVRSLLDERLKEEFPPGKLENLSVAYAKMGLIEEGVDLKEAFLALYSEQMAAFYDQKKRKLYPIEGMPFSEKFQKLILVHELTHALQDQNFDLSRLPLECADNDDLAMGALSLVEGDASLAMAQYSSQKANLGFTDILSSATMGQKGLKEAPYVVKKNLMFPYMEGIQFVTEAFTKEGWEGINRIYKDPPQSTEQIMHPEKYFGTKDKPIPIALPDLSSVGGKKWELLEDNVLGELNTKVFFTQFVGSIRAIKPSRGWGGDRFRVYREEGKSQTILAWGTAWDTEKDREEFVSRYVQSLKKKYDGKKFQTVEGADCTWLRSGDLVIWLGWMEKTALVLEAPDEAILSGMIWEFLKAGGGFRMTQEALVEQQAAE
jgi:hypothetical protein